MITAPDNTEIQTIEDLGGKRVPAGSGRANALFMESYNEQNSDNPISIQYTDADASEALIDLHNGRYDACIYNQTYVTNVNAEYGYDSTYTKSLMRMKLRFRKHGFCSARVRWFTRRNL